MGAVVKGQGHEECCRDRGNHRCCSGYKGWLRTIKVAFVATGHS